MFYIFFGCSSLTSIAVAEGNTFYNSCSNCNAIIETSTNTLIAGCENTIIPKGVTSIGQEAFYLCSGLTNITIPEGVTSIGNYVFQGCSDLSCITIPKSMVTIGEYVFYGCEKLSSFISLIEEPFAVDFEASWFAKDATLYVPAGTKEKYQATSGWDVFQNIVELNDVNVTLQYNLTTFTSAMPLDFSKPIEGLKAYTIISLEGDKVQLQEVTTTVPGGTGIILKGTVGKTYQIPYATTITPVTGNLLVGVTADTQIGGNGEDYILSKTGKFVKANAGTLPAGKAYLKIPGSSESRELTLVFDEATGIDATLTNVRATNAKVFNLNGQLVSQPAKGGLYVVDGKKIFIK